MDIKDLPFVFQAYDIVNARLIHITFNMTHITIVDVNNEHEQHIDWRMVIDVKQLIFTQVPLDNVWSPTSFYLELAGDLVVIRLMNNEVNGSLDIKLMVPNKATEMIDYCIQRGLLVKSTASDTSMIEPIELEQCGEPRWRKYNPTFGVESAIDNWIQLKPCIEEMTGTKLTNAEWFDSFRTEFASNLNNNQNKLPDCQNVSMPMKSQIQINGKKSKKAKLMKLLKYAKKFSTKLTFTKLQKIKQKKKYLNV